MTNFRKETKKKLESVMFNQLSTTIKNWNKPVNKQVVWLSVWSVIQRFNQAKTLKKKICWFQCSQDVQLTAWKNTTETMSEKMNGN